MRGFALLAALLLPLPAGTLPGQATDVWRLDAPHQRPVLVRADTSAGFGALPASALVANGAEVGRQGDAVEVQLGAVRADFRVGSASFALGDSVFRLDHAVYEHNGAVYVPLQFIRDYLPRVAGPYLTVDVRQQRISGALPHVRANDLAPAPANFATFSVDSAASEDADADAPAPMDRIAALLAGGTRAAPPVPDAARPRPEPPASPADAAPAAKLRRLVVIDAGHGGVDPGASGPSGVREKNITLAVARRVAALLRADADLEVRMTRDADTLIALQDRGRLANRWRDDGQPAVFLSIHCNAHPNRTVRGIETYFLSEAKTEDARRVAKMENAAERYEDTDAAGDAFGFILGDLRQNQYLRESSDWAEMVQDRVAALAPPDRGVRQAGFAVLNGAFMPAVLVEIGFLSNAEEERRLAAPEYQQQVARQLATSVRQFFDR